MNYKHIWITHRGCIIVIASFCILIICLILVCSIISLRSTFYTFRVEIVGVSNKIGPDGNPVDFSSKFPSKSGRIYMSFELDSKEPVRLKVRWYHEDELILETEDLFKPGLNYAWIASRNEYFTEGRYKVQVGRRTLEFQVEDDNVQLN